MTRPLRGPQRTCLLRMPLALTSPAADSPWVAARAAGVDGGPALAHLWRGNLLADTPRPPPDAAPGAPWIIWSGSLNDDLGAAEPRNWLGPGRQALDPAASNLAAEAGRRGAKALIRPHARHVLSDAISTRRWLQSQTGSQVGLALDPLALLEPAMLPAADEHLERIFQALGPACVALLCFGDASEPPNSALHDPSLADLIAQGARRWAPRVSLVVAPRNSPAAVMDALRGYTAPSEE